MGRSTLVWGRAQGKGGHKDREEVPSKREGHRVRGRGTESGGEAQDTEYREGVQTQGRGTELGGTVSWGGYRVRGGVKGQREGYRVRWRGTRTRGGGVQDQGQGKGHRDRGRGTT